jgi:hypothetical protein
MSSAPDQAGNREVERGCARREAEDRLMICVPG